jgi:hypothetical protein
MKIPLKFNRWKNIWDQWYSGLEKNNLSNFRNLKNNTAIIQKAHNND